MEDTPAPPNIFTDDVLLEVLARVAMPDIAARVGAVPCEPAVFMPSARSAFGLGRRSLTSFIRGSAAGLLDGAKPLATREGFLLVRLAPVTCGSDIILLAACNVLAGTCDVLPPLENRSSARRIRYGYAILTANDCGASNHSTRFFKVLAMGLVSNVNDQENLQCDLHTLTSDEPSWTTHTECFMGAIDLCWRHWKDAVVCDGVVSWLYASMSYNDNIGHLQFSTVDVSAKNGRLTLTKLLFPPPMILPITGCYRLAAVGGTVSLLCYYIKHGEKHFCQETWKQRDDIGGDWPCSRAMKLTGPGEEAAGPLSPMAMDDVPMEIDWPALLISRLARYA